MESEPCIKILKALADSTRWQIVMELLQNSMTIGELATHLQARHYNISKHVRVLREAGVVVTWKEGKTIMCHIEPALRTKGKEKVLNLDLGCCICRFDSHSKCH